MDSPVASRLGVTEMPLLQTLLVSSVSHGSAEKEKWWKSPLPSEFCSSGQDTYPPLAA